MAVPPGYIKIVLLLSLPWIIIAFLTSFIGVAMSEIPYPLDWIITFAQIISFTVSGLLIGYMIIAVIHG